MNVLVLGGVANVSVLFCLFAISVNAACKTAWLISSSVALLKSTSVLFKISLASVLDTWSFKNDWTACSLFLDWANFLDSSVVSALVDFLVVAFGWAVVFLLEIAFLLADGLSVDFVVALSVDVLSVAFWAVSLSDFLSVTFFVVVLSVVGVVLLEVAFTGVLSVEVLSEVCLSWETELVWFSLVLTVLLLVGCLSWVVAVVWSALLASSDAFVVALSVAWSSVLAVSLVLVS